MMSLTPSADNSRSGEPEEDRSKRTRVAVQASGAIVRRNKGTLLERTIKALDDLLHKGDDSKQHQSTSHRLQHVYSVARSTKGAFARSMQRLLLHPNVELSIVTLSFFSAGILAYTGPEPVPHSANHKLLVSHDFFFTIVFSLEVLVRGYAFGSQLFKDNWFRFDLFVCIICLVHLVITHALWMESSLTISMSMLRVLRILRLFRVLRILRIFMSYENSFGLGNVLRIFAQGIWEGRHVYIFNVCFMLIMSILAFVWFQNSLNHRCIVTGARVPGGGIRSDSFVPDKAVQRLLAGETWSAVSSTPPVFAQPKAYCNPRANSDFPAERFRAIGAHSCSGDKKQLCVLAEGIGDGSSPSLTFNQISSCMWSMLMILLSQEEGLLQKDLLQGSSLVVIPFFVVSFVFALVLMHMFGAVMHMVYQSSLEAEDQKKMTIDENQGTDGEEAQNAQGQGNTDSMIRNVLLPAIEHENSIRNRLTFLGLLCRVDSLLQRVQDFKISFLPISIWECVLYLCALSQFVAGFSRAWYLGKWRMLQLGLDNSQQLKEARVDKAISQQREAAIHDNDGITEAINVWLLVSLIAQWVFYVDLAIKIVRYRGLGPYLGASIKHWADFVATFSVLIAAYVWKVPDMTAFRGLRAFFFFWDDQSFTWSRRSKSFWRRLFLRENDAFHTTLCILTAAIVLQHQSDGDSENNQFFGSFCKSLTSLIRLSADQDLGSMIQARQDVDGLAFAILTVLICFLIQALFAKLIIGAMYCGIVEPQDKREMYQAFLARAIQKHPDLNEFLQNSGFGHLEISRIFDRALEMFPCDDAGCKDELLEMKSRCDKILESSGWDPQATYSENVINSALALLEDRLESRKKDRDEDGIEDYKGKKWNILQAKTRKLMKDPKTNFVFDLVTVAPIALLSFGCHPDWGCIKGNMLRFLEIFLLVFFTLECVAKLFVFSPIRGSDAYFRSVQNWFDFLVLGMFWLSFLQLFALSTRVVFCSRIYRLGYWLFGYFRATQWTINCLTASLQQIGYIFAAFLCLVMVLCPLMMQSYSGQWYTCNDSESEISGVRTAKCVGSFSSSFPLRAGENMMIYKQRSTIKSTLNFDDISSAFYTLLLLASQNGWSHALDNAMGWSVTGHLRHHEETVVVGRDVVDNSITEWSVIPLLVYQFILYLGLWPAIVASHILAQRKLDGKDSQTTEQTKWRASLHLLRLRGDWYLIRKKILWKTASNLSMSRPFEWIFNVTVLVNVICTILEFLLQDEETLAALQAINLLCLILYYFEMFTYLLASPTSYITSAWGCFDIGVNIVCLIDLCVSVQENGGRVPSGSSAQVLRAMKAMRILKVFTHSTRLQLLVSVFVQIGLKLFFPLLVLLFSVICFAAVAVQIPGNGEDAPVPDIDSYSNFNSFQAAAVVLLRVITGGGMYPLIEYFQMVCPPVGILNTCESSNSAGRVLLLLYAMLYMFFLKPMLVAIVFSEVFDVYDLMHSLISREDLDVFEECWTKIDVNREGFIPTWKVHCLMDRLKNSKSVLHFAASDKNRMQFLHDNLHELLVASDSIPMGRPKVSTLAQLRFMLEQNCYVWAFPPLEGGQKRYGVARFDWVVIILLYIRTFPQNVPDISTRDFTTAEGRRKFELSQAGQVFEVWVKFYTMMTLPKLRRRLVANSTYVEYSDLGNRNQASPSRIVDHYLSLIPSFSMLEHPRFSMDWFCVCDSHDKMGENVYESEFKRRLAEQWKSGMYSHLAHEIGGARSLEAERSKSRRRRDVKRHCPATSQTCAINGDQGPPIDPFLDFDNIEGMIEDQLDTKLEVILEISDAQLSNAKKNLLLEALATVVYSGLSRQGERGDPRIPSQSPIESKEKTMSRIRIVDTKTTCPRPNLAGNLQITIHVDCRGEQHSMCVKGLLVDHAINQELHKLNLPNARILGQPKTAEKIAAGHGGNQEMIMATGFLSSSHLDIVSLAMTMGKQFDGVEDLHSRYSFAVTLTTDLALALGCAEDQILIQDISNGRTCTRIVLCIASSELHVRSSRDLAVKLIADAHIFQSDLRQLLPSVVSVQWVPDRAKTGTNNFYYSEYAKSTLQSLGAHIAGHVKNDVLLQKKNIDERNLQGKAKTRLKSGILKKEQERAFLCERCKSSEVVSHNIQIPGQGLMLVFTCISCNHEWQKKANVGKVSDRKWSKVLEPHVSITSLDKMTEANHIFDGLDIDKSNSLSHAEVILGMVRLGFAQDEIGARLPHVLTAMDSNNDGEISREEFVNYWMTSRDDDPDRLFDRLDLDKNGLLTRTELRAGLLQEGYTMEEISQRVPKVFATMDTDNDGTVSKKEFRQYWVKLREAGIQLDSAGALTALKQYVPPKATEFVSDMTENTTWIFERVGNSVMAPLPDHIKDLFDPTVTATTDIGKGTKSDGRDMVSSSSSNAKSFRYGETFYLRSKRKQLSPREILADAVGAFEFRNSQSNREQQQQQGWAASIRDRLSMLPAPFTTLLPGPSASSEHVNTENTEVGGTKHQEVKDQVSVSRPNKSFLSSLTDMSMLKNMPIEITLPSPLRSAITSSPRSAPTLEGGMPASVSGMPAPPRRQRSCAQPKGP